MILNHENKLDIKNVMIDQGDHYFVKLPGGKNFLADKIDLPFIGFPVIIMHAANKMGSKFSFIILF